MRIFACLVIVGCGGGSGSDMKLDCAYLGSDNCWKTTATAATSCLPADGTTGVLSGDNTSCTYASGQLVTFAAALVLPLPSQFEDWNFTVTTNGQPCLHYEESSSGFEMTVGGQDTVAEMLFGAGGLELTCPDGTTFSNANALSLLDCPGSSFGDLPGNTTSSSDTSVQFALFNTGAPDPLTVFDCSR